MLRVLRVLPARQVEPAQREPHRQSQARLGRLATMALTGKIRPCRGRQAQRGRLAWQELLEVLDQQGQPELAQQVQRGRLVRLVEPAQRDRLDQARRALQASKVHRALTAKMATMGNRVRLGRYALCLRPISSPRCTAPAWSTAR